MRVCRNCKMIKSEPDFSEGKTWCDACLFDWELRRSAPEARANLFRRFDAKVAYTGECWNWTGATNGQGYGNIGVEGRTCYAHRVAYERWNGSLAPGIHVDHLCRNKACVNPAHLEAIAPKENFRRGLNGALKTHCAQGHPWTDEHIYVRPGNGQRMCRTCYTERNVARSAGIS